MSFKEDIFAKIVTFITVTVLLASMILEAFYIYNERNEIDELHQRLARAESNINSLVNTNETLNKKNTELQEFKDNWETLVILTDNELCVELRNDLSERPELIPSAAIEESLSNEEADRIVKEEEDPEECKACFNFPDPENKDWLIPLNHENEESLTYLFYARAEDIERGKVIDLLYEIPVYHGNGNPRKDENGDIIWNCIAYDAGSGWQITLEEEAEE